MKRWLFSNFNVILWNINKTGAIFKTHLSCLSSKFLLHKMSHKLESFQKDMLEKHCAVGKSYWWQMEEIIIHWENYVTQRQIWCQVYKSN